jgi:hypothetical protein
MGRYSFESQSGACDGHLDGILGGVNREALYKSGAKVPLRQAARRT